MLTLMDCFIKDEAQNLLEKEEKLYSIALVYRNKTVRLFTTKKEDKNMWLTKLKEALGYAKFSEYYLLGVLTIIIFEIS